MGMGLGVELISEWPQEVVRRACPICGSIVDITRYQRPRDSEGRELPLPFEIAARETEQYCPVCGEPLSSEIPVGQEGAIAWIGNHKVLSLLVGTGIAGGLYVLSRRG